MPELGSLVRHASRVAALSIGLTLNSGDPAVAQDGAGAKPDTAPTSPMPAEALQPLVLPPLNPAERAEVQGESQKTQEPTNVDPPEQAKAPAQVEPSAPEQAPAPEQAEAPEQVPAPEQAQAPEQVPAPEQAQAPEQMQAPEQAQVPSGDTGAVAAIPAAPASDGILARAAQWLSKDLTS